MLILSLIIYMLTSSFNTRDDLSINFSRAGLLITLYCTFLSFTCFTFKYLNKGLGLLGGLFYVTSITQTFQIFIFLICFIIIQLNSFYPRKIMFTKIKSSLYKETKKILNKTGEQFKIIEYCLILLFIVTGAIFLLSTNDIVSIFLSIELQSYGLYILCTLYRNSELATSSGLTYFLLGGLSSCFILLGTSLLYANSGTTNLEALYIISNISNNYDNNINSIINLYNPNYINYSLLIMCVGFLFKISAAPFHYWSPDVYDGIPTISTTFVSIIAKLSVLLLLFNIVHYTIDFYLKKEYTWVISLLLSSLLSLIFGSVLGLTESRIKRLLAYSTISHLGFMLLVLCINNVESVQTFIFYILQYTISSLNTFFILISLGYFLYCYTNNDKNYEKMPDKNNSPIQLLSQIKGYFQINPVLSISFSITIFSFLGVPPLIGFFAKQMVLSTALENGYFFMSFVCIITSVISAVYYLAMVKTVFFDECEYKINSNFKYLKVKPENILLSSSLTITISVLSLIISFFIFIPDEILNLINILAVSLFL